MDIKSEILVGSYSDRTKKPHQTQTKKIPKQQLKNIFTALDEVQNNPTSSIEI